jgi:protocatechuate 3,4-dioxygenase beta subunit
MTPRDFFPARRTFLRGGLALGAAAFTTPGLFAEQLLRTPPSTEGPFYPDKLPLDTDNDLIIVNNALTPAVGEITHLTGRVVDIAGSPVRNALVEIWQCDAKEVYLHTADSGKKSDQQDKNFQGFGRFMTGSDGAYYFRTIKPVPYPGRPSPHIHFKVKKGNRDLITTQLFIAGHPGNPKDGVFRGADAIGKELLQAEFKPIKESRAGELSADFLIVVGATPDERTLGAARPENR